MVVYASGTLGDLFKIFSKLNYFYSKKKIKISLIIFSKNKNHFYNIKELSKYFFFIKKIRFIEYRKDNFNSFLKKLSQKKIYLNSNTNFIDNIKIDHSSELVAYPFSNKVLKNARNNKKIGIQVFGGVYMQNFRAFHKKFISKILHDFKEYDLYFFGDTKEQKIIDYYNFIPDKNNYISKLSFDNWINSLNKCDAFICFEGFPAFLSMSLKIPTLAYNHNPYPIEFNNNYLKDNNKIINFNLSLISKKMNYLLINLLYEKINYYNPKLESTFINRFV